MLKLPPCSQSGKLPVISDHCALLRDKSKHIIYFIIRCKFFFLFIGWKPTTWPANNCLQIMVCSSAMSSNCVWLSPAKNVWLVDARPRDIAKFKMAAIPPSFVYTSGKKVNCGLIWVANAYTDIFRIALTFYYPFSPIPIGFVPCDARVLAGLPDSTADSSGGLFTITKDNNTFDESRVTRRNGPCSQLNAAEK